MIQHSAASRKDISAAEKRARQVAVGRGDVLKAIMATPMGREWIWNELAKANMFSTIYDDNPQRLAYIAGRHDAGIELLADVMEFCPDQFIQSMREANERRVIERADAERRAGAGRNGDFGGPDSEADGDAGVRFVLDPNEPGGFRLEGPEEAGQQPS